MEFDFDLPSVSDDEVREIEIVKNGKSYGVFRVKHQFVSSPKWLLEWKRATARLSQRERQRIDDAQVEADVLLRRSVVIKMFVENYIVKSEGIPVKNGTWKHSSANLVTFLSDPRAYWIFQELDEFSSQESNFAVEATEESKKN
ncbi:hypothetical protein DM806_13760 [Sphingobium lactosutens]|mgnify:CR=1 FL=1|uniref:hypothetical protein n=1 Tax=Sphingobium lactosutens TaxID=522773 RepID=UPI0015BB175A|nr:hypothetical protein [Sphingobium lactosutens]NWK96707.1 hypothetical protein [Sphingobium lactosutens]